LDGYRYDAHRSVISGIAFRTEVSDNVAQRQHLVWRDVDTVSQRGVALGVPVRFDAFSGADDPVSWWNTLIGDLLDDCTDTWYHRLGSHWLARAVSSVLSFLTGFPWFARLSASMSGRQLPFFVHYEPTEGAEAALRSARRYDDPTAPFLGLIHVTDRRDSGHLDTWSRLLDVSVELDTPVLVSDNTRILFTSGTRSTLDALVFVSQAARDGAQPPGGVRVADGVFRAGDVGSELEKVFVVGDESMLRSVSGVRWLWSDRDE
jgi:hypothetical protein